MSTRLTSNTRRSSRYPTTATHTHGVLTYTCHLTKNTRYYGLSTLRVAPFSPLPLSVPQVGHFAHVTAAHPHLPPHPTRTFLTTQHTCPQVGHLAHVNLREEALPYKVGRCHWPAWTPPATPRPDTPTPIPTPLPLLHHLPFKVPFLDPPGCYQQRQSNPLFSYRTTST